MNLKMAKNSTGTAFYWYASTPDSLHEGHALVAPNLDVRRVRRALFLPRKRLVCVRKADCVEQRCWSPSRWINKNLWPLS